MPTLAEPLPYTLLSLSRYARIMQINPVHFWGSVGQTVFPLRGNSCNSIFPYYSWQQSDLISHQDIAITIAQAEQDLAEQLGWYPAPMWIAQEVHYYPHHYRRDVYRYDARNVRGMNNSLQTDYAKVIAPGQRGTTFIANVRVAYTDVDSDGFFETATVTTPTTETNANEVKVYFENENGDERWEIRDPRSKNITGGVYTAVFDSWLFVDPDLRAAYPTTADFMAVDISTVANFVSSVDVYREYNDTTSISSQLYWEPQPVNLLAQCCSSCGGSGCSMCQLTVQDGCLHVRDAENGMVVPQTAVYNDDTGYWDYQSMSVCRDPDFVKLWYYAGNLDQRYLAGRNKAHDMLSDFWAQTIAYLATARLERPFCTCGAIKALAAKYQVDLASNSAEQKQAQSYQISQSLVIENPFGTRMGEVMAWQRVLNTKNKVMKVAII